jgi:hypothetical protein
VYGQGFWQSKPNVLWPSQYGRDLPFFLSGQSWQQVMDTQTGTAPGYYQLADQYMAAVLNIANQVFYLNQSNVPSDVQNVLIQATDWFGTNYPSACVGAGSCADQKNWATILANYNNGLSAGGPTTCGVTP